MSNIMIIILTFCGGVFGASIGGLWAFILCTFIVLFGSILVLAGGNDFLLLQVGLGPIFGPVAGGFLSGVIASTYAKAKGNHPTDNAKDIVSPLMATSWDVLVVGGIGSVICYYLTLFLAKVPILQNGDTGAMAIIIVSLVARVIFLKEGIFGSKSSISKYGLLGTDNYRLSWVGWMSPTPLLITISIAVGGVSASIAYGLEQALNPLVLEGVVSETAANIVPLFFMWAVSGIMLIILQLGQGATAKIPVTHAMSLIAALMYLKTSQIYGAEVGIFFGILGSVMAMIAQEFGARIFYNHGSNHIDPPAFSIAVNTCIIGTFFNVIS